MRIVKTAEENEPADRPPDSTSDMPSAELEEEEANDPNSLASLLERVLQKVSQLPGALEALSSDPQLLHDLQEHEFLIYPITPPVSSSQDASIVHRRSISSSSHRSNSDAQLSSDDEDLTESVDMTSELFGSEYEAELQAVESLQRGKSMNMVIPRGSSMLVAAHDLSTSPSYSMGMLSLSPGASSQDGDPVSAVWPRRPNEFAFSQPDETKDDDLYNEALFSELDDDTDDKVFDMEDMHRHGDDDGDGDVEYDVMRLRIVRERHRTGFEPSHEFLPEAGTLVGATYVVRIPFI
ncbi:hypothetical protein AaE_007351, partial [Aphanomyces astaci]